MMKEMLKFGGIFPGRFFSLFCPVINYDKLQNKTGFWQKPGLHHGVPQANPVKRERSIVLL